MVKISKDVLDERLNNLSNEYKSFDDKKNAAKSEMGDQVVFNYQATVDGKEYGGGKGEGVAIELGKDLFLQGFDKQLVGVKKDENVKVTSILPQNHPKKELSNKKAIFECKITNVKGPKKQT